MHCGLDVPYDGLTFPPCGADDLSSVLRPQHLGGALADVGMVEVVSSLRRDGQPVERDLRWGVYVVFKAESDYAASARPTHQLSVRRTFFATIYPFGDTYNIRMDTKNRC